MKTMMLAAAAMTLAVAVNATAALAESPKAGGYAMYQTAEMQPPNRAMSPRYVWQYHYGKKAQFEGHWVLAR